MSDEIIDAAGREYTTDVKNELKGRLALVEQRVKALESRPATSAGLNRDQVWALAGDRIGAELANTQSPLSVRIAQASGVTDIDALLKRVKLGLVIE